MLHIPINAIVFFMLHAIASYPTQELWFIWIGKTLFV